MLLRCAPCLLLLPASIDHALVCVRRVYVSSACYLRSTSRPPSLRRLCRAAGEDLRTVEQGHARRQQRCDRGILEGGKKIMEERPRRVERRRAVFPIAARREDARGSSDDRDASGQRPTLGDAAAASRRASSAGHGRSPCDFDVGPGRPYPKQRHAAPFNRKKMSPAGPVQRTLGEAPVRRRGEENADAGEPRRGPIVPEGCIALPFRRTATRPASQP